MPSEQCGTATLRDALHRLHGGQLMAARDHMPEEPSEAIHARGKAEAFERVLFLLDHLDEHGELLDLFSDELWDAYAEVSRAAIAADREEFDSQHGEGAPSVGVQ